MTEEASVNTIAYAVKLPTAQLWKWGEYFTDWITGEDEPESLVGGIVHGVVRGKQPR